MNDFGLNEEFQKILEMWKEIPESLKGKTSYGGKVNVSGYDLLKSHILNHPEDFQNIAKKYKEENELIEALRQVIENKRGMSANTSSNNSPFILQDFTAESKERIQKFAEAMPKGSEEFLAKSMELLRSAGAVRGNRKDIPRSFSKILFDAFVLQRQLNEPGIGLGFQEPFALSHKEFSRLGSMVENPSAIRDYIYMQNGEFPAGRWLSNTASTIGSIKKLIESGRARRKLPQYARYNTEDTPQDALFMTLSEIEKIRTYEEQILKGEIGLNIKPVDTPAELRKINEYEAAQKAAQEAIAEYPELRAAGKEYYYTREAFEKLPRSYRSIISQDPRAAIERTQKDLSLIARIKERAQKFSYYSVGETGEISEEEKQFYTFRDLQRLRELGEPIDEKTMRPSVEKPRPSDLVHTINQTRVTTAQYNEWRERRSNYEAAKEAASKQGLSPEEQREAILNEERKRREFRAIDRQYFPEKYRRTPTEILGDFFESSQSKLGGIAKAIISNPWVKLAAILGVAGKAVQAFTQNMIKGALALAQFNPLLARAKAETEQQEFIRKLQIGRSTGGTGSDLISRFNQLKNELVPLTSDLKNLGNTVASVAVEIGRAGASIYNKGRNWIEQTLDWLTYSQPENAENALRGYLTTGEIAPGSAEYVKEYVKKEFGVDLNQGGVTKEQADLITQALGTTMAIPTGPGSAPIIEVVQFQKNVVSLLNNIDQNTRKENQQTDDNLALQFAEAIAKQWIRGYPQVPTYGSDSAVRGAHSILRSSARTPTVTYYPEPPKGRRKTISPDFERPRKRGITFGDLLQDKQKDN